MICPKCGTYNDEDSNFCIKCGNVLNDNQSFMQNSNTPVQNENNINLQSTYNQQPVYKQSSDNYQQPIVNQNNKKNNNKKIILIVSIALVVIAITIVGVKVFSGKKDKSKGAEALISFDDPIRVKKDDKYGYIDSKGNFIVEPKYTYADFFHSGYAIVSERNGNQLIDSKGNVIVSTRTDEVKYLESSNKWIINEQLFDSSMKKLSADDVKVYFDKYDNKNYLGWSSKNAVGIMTTDGKITYTRECKESDCIFPSLDESFTDDGLKDRYCIFELTSIVNCDTGKVVYETSENVIFKSDNNIFYAEDHNYEVLFRMYIQDDKVFYKTDSKNVHISYDNGFLKIRDSSKEYDSMYTYIDLSTGKVTDKDTGYLSKEKSDVKDEWEKYTKLTKVSCDNFVGLKSGDSVKLPCVWKNIKYFNLKLYKALSYMGKEYVIADGGKIYLLNLKDGTTGAEFNTSLYDFKTYPNSTFIAYKESKTKNIVIYNLITGKSISLENQSMYNISEGVDSSVSGSSSYIGMDWNYIIVKENGKLNYYNMDLELIYTGE